VNSKAGFHGYCVWVRPKDDCNAQAVTQGIMQQFTRRFPPLLMPTWQPHICLAAGAPSPLPPENFPSSSLGIDDEAAALKLAQQVHLRIQRTTALCVTPEPPCSRLCCRWRPSTAASACT